MQAAQGFSSHGAGSWLDMQSTIPSFGARRLRLQELENEEYVSLFYFVLLRQSILPSDSAIENRMANVDAKHVVFNISFQICLPPFQKVFLDSHSPPSLALPWLFQFFAWGMLDRLSTLIEPRLETSNCTKHCFRKALSSYRCRHGSRFRKIPVYNKCILSRMIRTSQNHADAARLVRYGHTKRHILLGDPFAAPRRFQNVSEGGSDVPKRSSKRPRLGHAKVSCRETSLCRPSCFDPIKLRTIW